ncbi:hypothetical protein KIH74_07485 [Kineosporia sp. J2-2]|uniref:Lipoprotein n=1 Tax=Kineosporia corallincola TaxID=2835133 RepID=A0ABS5TCF1_9ACTN|nr:hypothetical protein [Kineosporia corallincola]MBT0768762.1 hypothetical protein [Kineosporia corallincola]
MMSARTGVTRTGTTGLLISLLLAACSSGGTSAASCAVAVEYQGRLYTDRGGTDG